MKVYKSGVNSEGRIRRRVGLVDKAGGNDTREAALKTGERTIARV